jgi:hypothetical protein
VWDFKRRIVDCEREYQTLNENLRGLITFHHFLSYKNPSWSKDKVTHWIGVVEEKRAREARWEMDLADLMASIKQNGERIRKLQKGITNGWKEEQSIPTPIESTQLCYSCKVPCEPEHRCRCKGKKHIIEVHYYSDDEVCEDGAIDAYLEQCDDASDSCTDASDSDTLEEDSDSCTLVDTSDYGTLGEDGDPCVVDRQSEERDDSTCILADISHGVDDPHLSRVETLVGIHTC